MTATITAPPTRKGREQHETRVVGDEAVPVTTRAIARQTYGPLAKPTFAFDDHDDDVDSWPSIGLRAFLVTVFTLGICYPWALVAVQSWKAEHTLIDGQRLHFTGDPRTLFGPWLRWWGLSVVTLGVYSLWVAPRLTRWVVEHQGIDARR